MIYEHDEVYNKILFLLCLLAFQDEGKEVTGFIATQGNVKNEIPFWELGELPNSL